ncbi:hypothetical protein LXL04_019916 [Taraxacum kok-saghyz]
MRPTSIHRSNSSLNRRATSSSVIRFELYFSNITKHMEPLHIFYLKVEENGIVVHVIPSNEAIDTIEDNILWMMAERGVMYSNRLVVLLDNKKQLFLPLKKKAEEADVFENFKHFKYTKSSNTVWVGCWNTNIHATSPPPHLHLTNNTKPKMGGFQKLKIVRNWGTRAMRRRQFYSANGFVLKNRATSNFFSKGRYPHNDALTTYFRSMVSFPKT